MTIKSRKAFIQEDNSPENLIKDLNGNIVGYKRSRYTVNVPFEITKLWTPFNEEIAEIIKQIAECEDKKYPYGMGRNMFFYKFVFPIYEKELFARQKSKGWDVWGNETNKFSNSQTTL